MGELYVFVALTAVVSALLAGVQVAMPCLIVEQWGAHNFPVVLGPILLSWGFAGLSGPCFAWMLLPKVQQSGSPQFAAWWFVGAGCCSLAAFALGIFADTGVGTRSSSVKKVVGEKTRGEQSEPCEAA